MSFNLNNKTPENIFQAHDELNNLRSSLSETLVLLESIMLNSDIDTHKDIGGITTWKQKIMKELMKYGYTWDGGAHEANILFGENYGIDWI